MNARSRPIPALIVSALLCAAALASGQARPSAEPTPYGAFRRALIETCRNASPLDRNGDGIYEIESLQYVDAAQGRQRGSVVVMVEDRLWQRPEKDAPDLRSSLQTFISDIARDGFHAGLVVSRLHASSRHQDGETVLAVRDWLKRIYRRTPDLRAAVFVGNHPTAFMVRQYYWRRTDGLTLHAGTSAAASWKAVPHVRSIAEPVASPADIVLADLDGNWDQAYTRLPSRLAGLLAAFPDDPNGEVTSQFQYTAERYEDFVLVQDGAWEESPAADGKRRFRFVGERNDECAPDDLRRVNVLAQPEIAIGRINAWHVALEPDPDIRGSSGEGLLDAQGRPQAVEFGDPARVPTPERIWRPSERLERRLLVEYFARNHRYRTATTSGGHLPASITTEWGSSVADMRAGIPGFRDTRAPDLDVVNPKTTIADFATWMTRPALTRAIKAHAGPTGFGFEPPTDFGAFRAIVGQSWWWWTKQGSRLVPDPQPLSGWVNYGLLRSLYENRKLSGAPALYLHTGCEGIQPANYDREPYNSFSHGRWQIAEALLMFGDGLALVGRGKVFYDEPREFWKRMGEGATFGDAWRHYFDVESRDAELAKDGIGRKRAYFWSVIGDCTLSLPADLLGAAPPGP